MKRFFVSVLVLAAMLAVTTGTAFAGSALELVEVRNSDGGVTFIFRVTGEFSQDELNSGFVQVEGGDDFPLYCAQRDATTVVCHTSGKTGGSNVVVGFGGARFWTDVPEFSLSGVSQYCSALYDLSFSLPGWNQFGEHCMDRPAVEGDTFVTYNPYIGSPDWTYFFLNNAPAGYGNDPGDGYYPIGGGFSPD